MFSQWWTTMSKGDIEMSLADGNISAGNAWSVGLYRPCWHFRTLLGGNPSYVALINMFPILCGISDELLCRLQKVQNNTARVVSDFKYDHITPILKDLHLLPSRKRIEFKTLPCNACKEVPPILEGIVGQTSHYKDTKIKH